MDRAPRPRVPLDPYPLAPNHGDVVDGGHVTLRWEPVAEAAAYAVEIAEDPEFHHVVFSEEGPASVVEIVVDRPFPDDGRTVYWRVCAGNACGWGRGGRIEGFTCGSPDQAGRFSDPDEDEPFGPLASILWSLRRRRRQRRPGRRSTP